MKSKKEACKNCEQLFKKSFKFCPHCGQQVNDELTVGVLFYNTISNYFSFDARFFKSFLPLMLRPGYLAKKFVEGKHLLFLHPAQMYLFIAVVFFFLFSFIQRDQVKSLDSELAKTLKREVKQDVDIDEKNRDSLAFLKLKQTQEKDPLKQPDLVNASKEYGVANLAFEIDKDSLLKTKNLNSKSFFGLDDNMVALDSLISHEAPEEKIYRQMGMNQNAGFIERRIYAQSLKFYKSRKGGTLLQAFYDAIPIAMFFLLPIFALILKLLFFKTGMYAHHLVFSFYYFSFLFAVFSLILAVNFMVDVPDWIDWFLVFSTFFYLLLAIKTFYHQGWFKSLLKTIIATFSFLLFVAPLAVFILGVFAFLFH